MKKYLEQFLNKGKVITHYYNGYGFTNKTKQIKEFFESKGFINNQDFKIINFIGENSRTKIIKL
jgi:hypothetical protein